MIAGELVANLDAQRNVLSVSGETLPGRQGRHLAAAQLLRRARQAATRRSRRARASPARGCDAGIPELAIYDARLLGGPGPNVPTLVWQVEVKGKRRAADRPAGVRRRPDRQRRPQHQPDRERQEPLRSATATTSPPARRSPAPSPVATEADPPGAGDDADVAPAFEFAGDTYDFYFTRFGRDSLDGAGLPLESTVDYCDPTDDVPAAQRVLERQQMAYGDGYASADDVVGHELTHGVTEFSSHLFYYFQSGAINESLSDVFGEFIDQTNGAGNDTARREVAARRGPPEPIGVIRNMKTPADLRRPRPDDQPALHVRPGRGDAAASTPTAASTTRPPILITDGRGRPAAASTADDQRPRRHQGGADLLRGRDRASSPRAATTPTSARALPRRATTSSAASGITAADCTQVPERRRGRRDGAPNPPAAPAPEAPARRLRRQPGDPEPLFSDDMENSRPAATTTGPPTTWRLGLRRRTTPTAASSTCAARDLPTIGTRRSS